MSPSFNLALSLNSKQTLPGEFPNANLKHGEVGQVHILVAVTVENLDAQSPVFFAETPTGSKSQQLPRFLHGK